MNKQANDIDGEHASKARFAVVTASSSGGLHALSEILSRLPHDFPGAVLVVQHRAPSPPYLLAQILGRRTTLNVMDAHEGAAITAGTVYIASPEAHLVVRPDRTLGYIDHQRIRFLRSSANPLLESASKVYGKNLVAVVLTGADSDATDGVQSVRKHAASSLPRTVVPARSVLCPAQPSRPAVSTRYFRSRRSQPRSPNGYATTTPSTRAFLRRSRLRMNVRGARPR